MNPRKGLKDGQAGEVPDPHGHVLEPEKGIESGHEGRRYPVRQGLEPEKGIESFLQAIMMDAFSGIRLGPEKGIESGRPVRMLLLASYGTFSPWTRERD